MRDLYFEVAKGAGNIVRNGVSRKNPTEHYTNKFPLDHEHKLGIDIL